MAEDLDRARIAELFDELSKELSFSQTTSIKVGARIENILNHPTFFTGSHSIGSTQFGRVSSTFTGPPRIELLVRYEF